MLKLSSRCQTVLLLLIIMAGIALWLGLTLPVIKLTKYYFNSAHHSLYSAVEALLQSEEYFLGSVIFIFAIFLPVLKLLYLFLLAIIPAGSGKRVWRLLWGLDWIGKWSMHDVLMLALAVFLIKSSDFSEALTLQGIYFFVISVCLIIAAYWAVQRKHRLAFALLRERGQAGNGYMSPRRRYLIIFIILVAVVCLVLGVTQPSVKFTHFYVWSDRHSIYSVTLALYSEGEYFLSSILFIFSILFPAIKIVYLLTILLLPPLAPRWRLKLFERMEWMGRWSMTDVMILALMVFYLNGSAVSAAVTLPGIYFFAVSVFLTMVAYGASRVRRGD